MSLQSIGLNKQLHGYLIDQSLREPAVLQRLREETARLPEANMQIAPEQGQFMMLLLQMMGARSGIEIGVFTGYSTLCEALALPAEGNIVACDVSDRWTSIARRYWEEAGVAERIELHLAPALETLDHLIGAARDEEFDYAFIDADKELYPEYYERCLHLVRPGGLIMIDNVLWHGAVADRHNNEHDTRILRRLNMSLRSDRRVDLSMVPVGDGMTLLRKRAI